jgi:hypothetical protein
MVTARSDWHMAGCAAPMTWSLATPSAPRSAGAAVAGAHAPPCTREQQAHTCWWPQARGRGRHLSPGRAGPGTLERKAPQVGRQPPDEESVDARPLLSSPRCACGFAVWTCCGQGATACMSSSARQAAREAPAMRQGMQPCAARGAGAPVADAGGLRRKAAAPGQQHAQLAAQRERRARHAERQRHGRRRLRLGEAQQVRVQAHAGELRRRPARRRARLSLPFPSLPGSA